MSVTRRFDEFGFRPEILRAIKEAGYEICTPIQAKAIEPALDGSDLTGLAETGSGKTAAFLLPILQKITSQGDDPQALVVVPTRELAQQVGVEARRLGKYCEVRIATVYGGTGLGSQKTELLRGVDLVVGTPGRLIDFVRQTYLRLSKVRHLVLDEADRMLDMGFIKDIEFIMSKAPLSRQTLLFSATLPAEILRLAENFMYHPVGVEVERPSLTARNIEQWAETARGDAAKTKRLVELLRTEKPDQVLVFVATRERTSMVADALHRAGFRAASISSLLSQANRERVLAGFRAGETPILVGTDVAGRGLDIVGVSHVVNYDVPSVPDDYVHRVGRTARAGRAGRAITLVSPADRAALGDIERHIGIRLLRSDGDPEGGEAPRGNRSHRRPPGRASRSSRGRTGPGRSGGGRGGRPARRKRGGGKPG
ncbi:MAG: DEAD/DEAH box helicase [Acidobacteriota bacterium]